MKLYCVIMLSIAFCLLSCENSDNNLTYNRNGVLIDTNGKPFTGQKTNYYENGDIASVTSFVNGIRLGEWVVYGYDGEIIQKGKYLKPEKEIGNLCSHVKETNMEINNWFEGQREYYDIYFSDSTFYSSCLLAISNEICFELQRKVSVTIYLKKDSIETFEKIICD